MTKGKKIVAVAVCLAVVAGRHCRRYGDLPDTADEKEPA